MYKYPFAVDYKNRPYTSCTFVHRIWREGVWTGIEGYAAIIPYTTKYCDVVLHRLNFGFSILYMSREYPRDVRRDPYYTLGPVSIHPYECRGIPVLMVGSHALPSVPTKYKTNVCLPIFMNALTLFKHPPSESCLLGSLGWNGIQTSSRDLIY